VDTAVAEDNEVEDGEDKMEVAEVEDTAPVVDGEADSEVVAADNELC